MSPRLRTMWFVLIVVASVWLFVLASSAALNLSWVMTRVASGQYESLPTGLRVAYLAFAAVAFAQVILARRLLDRGGAWSHPSAVASMVLVIVYAISTVLNAVSSTNDERWNAVPALALMVSFFMLRGPAANHQRS